jgi:hypothetical protein
MTLSIATLNTAIFTIMPHSMVSSIATLNINDTQHKD